MKAGTVSVPLVQTEHLRKRFGDFTAVDNVSLALDAGRLTAIIGPNGAGKTTLINLVTGALTADGGRVYFRGEDITGLPVHARVRRGLARSFQLMNIFPRLTVLENVLVGVLARRGRSGSPWRGVARETAALAEADELLRAVGLDAHAHVPAAALAHGDQRLLELSMALANRPALCFLDEPSSGLTPVERSAVLELIRHLSGQGGTTFVIVEHDMDVVFALADWIVVLHRGRVLAEGPPAAIRDHREVREVYLGEEVLG